MLQAVSSSFATTASYVQNAQSASYVLQAVSASFATTASYVQNAQSASYVLQAVSSSYALSASSAATASSADSFVVRQNLTASNALISGTITAQTLVVQTVTSSVVYSSGSNVFGNSLSNTQIFTGSVSITGSLTVNGGVSNLTASNAISSSYPFTVTGSSIYSYDSIVIPHPTLPGIQDNSFVVGQNAGAGNTRGTDSVFIGRNAGSQSVWEENIFIGPNAGVNTLANNTVALGSEAAYLGPSSAVAIGIRAGYGATANSYDSNFIGVEAGMDAVGAAYSNFIGDLAGKEASTNSQILYNANFIGNYAGYRAVSASYSNFIGFQAGKANTTASSVGRNNIIIGTNVTLPAGYRDGINIGGLIFGSGSYYSELFAGISSGSANGSIGINQPNPQFNFDVSGSGRFTKGLIVTSSLIAPSITGSLFGTASWALNFITSSVTSASFASTASYAFNTVSSSYSLTATSASYSATASFIPTSSLTGDFFIQGGNSFGAPAVLGTNDDQDLQFETSGSVRVFVSGSNGFVGIDTIAPAYKLDVNGEIRAKTDAFIHNPTGEARLELGRSITGSRAVLFSDYTAGLVYYEPGFSNYVFDYDRFADSTIFQTNGSDKLTITNSGSIRFNTYTTNGLLKTTGSNGTVVMATASVDYVIPSTLNNYVLNSQTSSMSVLSSSYALTASYALNAGSGGGGGISAIYIADQGTLLGTASYFDFTGNVSASVSNGTASINIVGTGGAQFFTQSIAAATWSLDHNLNTYTPLIQVYDLTYRQLIPNEVIGITPSLSEIRFDYSQSGYAIVSTGGSLTITGSTAQLFQTTPAVTWSFAHNLNTRYPVFQVYDTGHNVIVPSGIYAVNSSNAEIYFAVPTAGIAVADFSGISGLQDTVISSSYAATASLVLGTIASASYATNADTASTGVNFTISNTLTLDATLTDYASINSSVVGSNNLFTQATGSYTSGFFKYTAASGLNARSGEVIAVWNGSNVTFTDNSTTDVGSTTAVTASVSLVSGDVQFNMQTNSSGWKIKSLATFI